MIDRLFLGDLVIFKDGRQGTVDFIRVENLYGYKFCDYHLDFDFWIRWVPGSDDVNEKTVRLLGIVKVVRHDPKGFSWKACGPERR